MPVLPRRRDEIGKPVQELKRRELDDAVRPRSRGLPPAPPPDPVGGFVSGEHVADVGDAAGWAADHGQSLQCKGGPGAVPQQVFQALEVARHVAVDERDPELSQPATRSRACDSVDSARSLSADRSDI